MFPNEAQFAVPLPRIPQPDINNRFGPADLSTDAFQMPSSRLDSDMIQPFSDANHEPATPALGQTPRTPIRMTPALARSQPTTPVPAGHEQLALLAEVSADRLTDLQTPQRKRKREGEKPKKKGGRKKRAVEVVVKREVVEEEVLELPTPAPVVKLSVIEPKPVVEPTPAPEPEPELSAPAPAPEAAVEPVVEGEEKVLSATGAEIGGVTLKEHALWRSFHEQTTEMIVSRPGR